jgi:hypothetical protein
MTCPDQFIFGDATLPPFFPLDPPYEHYRQAGVQAQA